MSVQSIISEKIRNKQGFTLDPKTHRLLNMRAFDGYMVSIPPNAVVEDLNGCLQAAIDNNALVGGWYDDMKGLYYLDVSERIVDLKEAVTKAIDREELAIWDCRNACEIRIPKLQKTGTLTQQATYKKMVIDKLITKHT